MFSSDLPPVVALLFDVQVFPILLPTNHVFLTYHLRHDRRNGMGVVVAGSSANSVNKGETDMWCFGLLEAAALAAGGCPRLPSTNTSESAMVTSTSAHR